MLKAGIYITLFLTLLLSACRSDKDAETLSHYIDVEQDTSASVESLVGDSYADVVADFGSPEYSYYYPGSHGDKEKTATVSTMTVIWKLNDSPEPRAVEIMDDVIAADEPFSGSPSAFLIVNFALQGSDFIAVQSSIGY